jgi:hypothetical protein
LKNKFLLLMLMLTCGSVKAQSTDVYQIKKDIESIRTLKDRLSSNLLLNLPLMAKSGTRVGDCEIQNSWMENDSFHIRFTKENKFYTFRISKSDLSKDYLVFTELVTNYFVFEKNSSPKSAGPLGLLKTSGNIGKIIAFDKVYGDLLVMQDQNMSVFGTNRTEPVFCVRLPREDGIGIY